MKITYTQYASDPALRGTTTNLPAHIAQVLIASGQATAVPMPPRGSAQWLAARNEQANMPRTPDPNDVVAPNVPGVQWEAKQLPAGRVVILRRSGSETARFEDPRECPDCPATVVKQFRELKADNTLSTGAEVLAAAKRQQAEYDERVKMAKRW